MVKYLFLFKPHCITKYKSIFTFSNNKEVETSGISTKRKVMLSNDTVDNMYRHYRPTNSYYYPTIFLK